MELKFRKLNPSEIQIKAVEIKSNPQYLTLIFYKTARVDRQILDETVGQMNWQIKFESINNMLFCYISIYNSDTYTWITKGDCGDGEGSAEGYSTPKTIASDAVKRAGFAWGIGTELYDCGKFIYKLEEGENSKTIGFRVKDIRDGKYIVEKVDRRTGEATEIENVIK